MSCSSKQTEIMKENQSHPCYSKFGLQEGGVGQ